MASPPPLSLDVVGSDTVTTTVSSSSTTPPRRSSPLQNLSPSILIIVTVLAVTVIVSLALCFLLRHINRRCLRRLSRFSATPSSSATPIFTSSRRISPEVPQTSSTSYSYIIDSLPLFTFSSVTRRSSAADCAVCLSKFRNDDLLRLLPICCHAFHAECIDTWLQSNLSCPLCRSAIVATESDLGKVVRSSSSTAGSDSFRLEIGNVSRRGTAPDGSAAVSGESRAGGARSRSYSIGSFEYFVDEDSEVPFSHAHRRSTSDQKDIPASAEAPASQHEANLAGEVGGVRSWLKEYMDRVSASISTRTASFRSSGRIFSGTGGSSRRSDVVPVVAAEYDIEGNRIGEEITEMFRWLSGV
ncbi:E3 ubiquitin-protein ligase ATL4-like [Arachis stenosperma]|uniref:E3 ubiquitin-protein ligase ATL4-like n=1 Tax=Arachis stenosperma TaxID=217475 RepID=UPI0025AD879F|nr:E3 ubiquitin-protein ligase ATL4-like [Arachis stenosperma]